MLKDFTRKETGVALLTDFKITLSIERVKYENRNGIVLVNFIC